MVAAVAVSSLVLGVFADDNGEDLWTALERALILQRWSIADEAIGKLTEEQKEEIIAALGAAWDAQKTLAETKRCLELLALFLSFRRLTYHLRGDFRLALGGRPVIGVKAKRLHTFTVEELTSIFQRLKDEEIDVVDPDKNDAFRVVGWDADRVLLLSSNVVDDVGRLPGNSFLFLPRESLDFERRVIGEQIELELLSRKSK